MQNYPLGKRGRNNGTDWCGCSARYSHYRLNLTHCGVCFYVRGTRTNTQMEAIHMVTTYTSEPQNPYAN